MDREPLEAKATKTWFVYDRRTDKVVHIHQFIPAHPGGTCSDREMEETALELQTAQEVGEQLMTLAQQVQDSPQLLQAHRSQISTLYCRGAFTAARTHFEVGLSLYDEQQHRVHSTLYGLILA